MTDLLKLSPALLIIDMQNEFCHPTSAFVSYSDCRFPRCMQGCFDKLGMPVSNHLDIIPAINKLRLARHGAELPIIFTRLCYSEDYLDADVQTEEQPQIKELQGFVGGTWDADILDELAPNTSQGEIVIDKTHKSAILKTNLKDVLYERGITSFCAQMSVATFALNRQ